MFVSIFCTEYIVSNNNYFERVFNLLRNALSFLSASFYIFGNIIFANVTTFGFFSKTFIKNIITSATFNEHNGCDLFLYLLVRVLANRRETTQSTIIGLVCECASFCERISFKQNFGKHASTQRMVKDFLANEYPAGWVSIYGDERRNDQTIIQINTKIATSTILNDSSI